MARDGEQQVSPDYEYNEYRVATMMPLSLLERIDTYQHRHRIGSRAKAMRILIEGMLSLAEATNAAPDMTGSADDEF